MPRAPLQFHLSTGLLVALTVGLILLLNFHEHRGGHAMVSVPNSGAAPVPEPEGWERGGHEEIRRLRAYGWPWAAYEWHDNYDRESFIRPYGILIDGAIGILILTSLVILFERVLRR